MVHNIWVALDIHFEWVVLQVDNVNIISITSHTYKLQRFIPNSHEISYFMGTFLTHRCRMFGTRMMHV
jgi:hypothetical protein